jgi:hypothetical protein
MDLARGIVDANNYMTLGTADASGVPWVSPVYFAPDGYRDFYWISEPGRQHSRNLAVRPQLSIVIFDSTVPVFQGQGVYLTATGGPVPETEADLGLALLTARGGFSIDLSTRFRLYRATASQAWVLDEGDSRVPVDLS